MTTRTLAHTAPGAVYLKSQSATHAVVAGYGVVFGGQDLSGETFTPDTDFWMGQFGVPLLMYQHGRDGRVQQLVMGKVPTIRKDEVGLWIEAQLELAAEYAAEVLELVKRGVLGWSSGSIPQLVQVERSVIKSWPIVEFSLTPTPAEPRTVGVRRLKAEAPAATIAAARLRHIGLGLRLAGVAVKEGRRNSTADSGRIQGAHDLTVELGATCATGGDGKAWKWWEV